MSEDKPMLTKTGEPELTGDGDSDRSSKEEGKERTHPYTDNWKWNQDDVAKENEKDENIISGAEIKNSPKKRVTAYLERRLMETLRKRYLANDLLVEKRQKFKSSESPLKRLRGRVTRPWRFAVVNQAVIKQRLGT